MGALNDTPSSAQPLQENHVVLGRLALHLGPGALARDGTERHSRRQWRGSRASEASVSSAPGNTLSSAASEPGGRLPCSVISSRPPVVTAPAARASTRARGQSRGDCRKLATTRSWLPSGKVSARSCSSKRRDPASPARADLSEAWASATADTSTAVTCQPCRASQSASSPRPQPSSSAVPGCSGPANWDRTRPGLPEVSPVFSR